MNDPAPSGPAARLRPGTSVDRRDDDDLGAELARVRARVHAGQRLERDPLADVEPEDSLIRQSDELAQLVPVGSDEEPLSTTKMRDPADLLAPL